PLCTLDFGLLQLRRDSAHDTFRNPVLQIEYVFEIAIVTVRPEMSARCSVDQLPRDTNPVRGLAHAALEYITHAEFVSHPLDIYRASLVGEARIAGNYKQPTFARQRADDVFDDAVGKVFLLRIAAQILKRQNHDRRLVGKLQRLRLGAAPLVNSLAA